MLIVSAPKSDSLLVHSVDLISTSIMAAKLGKTAKAMAKRTRDKVIAKEKAAKAARAKALYHLYQHSFKKVASEIKAIADKLSPSGKKAFYEMWESRPPFQHFLRMVSDSVDR